jgi:DNA polymerase-3 subunit gamma/tau
MSHQVLARKWRPRQFDQLIGQEHVVRALSNALTQGRLHHAYLFTGTRGCGKTTLARILAKCLNCETGVTATPCGECSACKQIEAGRFVDLIEIDAASYTGVDNMREVLENAQYAPTSGRYKIYIIDEVHMLSKSAFNAMLKTLEEPPAHVVFILATTDPQKVPVTVLSRCLQFNLKQMPPSRVAEHLRTILDSEGVPFDAGALNLLARAAAGSMRDALSLTDQAIAFGSGTVREQDTRDMLGTVDQGYLFPLLEALAENDGTRLMREAENIASRGLSFDAALQDLALLLHHMALARAVPEAVGEDVPERERLFALAQRIDAETLQLYYQIASLGRRDLEWAPDEYAGFSMTLLRMLAFAPDSAPSQTKDTPPAGAALSGGASLGIAATPSVALRHRSRPKPLLLEITKRQSPSAVRRPQSDAPAAKAAPTADSAAPKTGSAFDGDWFGLTRRLNGAVKQLASLCELAGHAPGMLSLRLPEAHKGLLDGFGDKLRLAICEQIGKDTRIDIELGRTQGDSPAEITARAKAERQSEAEAAIYADPFVQALIEQGGGTVTDIHPLQQ